MSEQEQNQAHEETERGAGSKTPDCCGSEMARKIETCGPGSSGKREPDGESKETRWPRFCEEMMTKMTDGENPTVSCPMSAMFKKTSGKRGFALLAMLPGLLLVLLGAAIVLEPQILVWLMAGASIVVGIALLAAAHFFRKLAAGLEASTG